MVLRKLLKNQTKMEPYIWGTLGFLSFVLLMFTCLCCVADSDSVDSYEADKGCLGRCGCRYCGPRFPCCICSIISDWYNLCRNREPDNEYWKYEIC